MYRFLSSSSNNSKLLVHDNLHAIPLQDIDALVVKVKADVKAKVKASLDICIPKLSVNLGVLAKADVKATIDVKAQIDAHLKVFVDACVKLLVNAKLVAQVKALNL